jgi:hypothetical protein
MTCAPDSPWTSGAKAVPHPFDLPLAEGDVMGLGSSAGLAAWLARLGYDTRRRQELTAGALGLTGEAAEAVRAVEVLAEDPDEFFRVLFVRLRSLSARARHHLVRVLRTRNVDHLLVLTSDFENLEFVLLDKRTRDRPGPGGARGVQIIPRSVAVHRRAPGRRELRTLRRLTWTCSDGLEQFDKLRVVFEAATYSGDHFQNRALFADYYLQERLHEDPAWAEDPAPVFATVRDLFQTPTRWRQRPASEVRQQLLTPLFRLLGFHASFGRPARGVAHACTLLDLEGSKRVTAFVYPWERWLDGPDANDPEAPDENPGAAVISALEGGEDWLIVTNGRLWRLYSRHAHARTSNFYEVDLVEALTASGDTDPGEGFRYWWLFFRRPAFEPGRAGTPCWLDRVVQESRDYARRLGDRLKGRIFETIFPQLARGFLEDRRQRLGQEQAPTAEELQTTFEATLTLLYRLLFLLYAESRELLPVREAPYREASLKKLKEEVAEHGGAAEGEVAQRLQRVYRSDTTVLYDRLTRLFEVINEGDPELNVPAYNGGLFRSRTDLPEERATHFLAEHKVPDLYLALALDRLARVPDERTCGLGFVDYKSLAVRHLGSIYEGLLEFKLVVAEQDLTTQTDREGERYIPLTKFKPRRGKAAEVVVRRGEVYLSNDKAQRKASGSYFTPDPIVEYIVERTVGPVLEERLAALRPEFDRVGATYRRYLEQARAHPGLTLQGGKLDERTFALEKMYAEHKDLVERLFDFRVLDPAMGSGHFLVEATDFVTDHLLHFLNDFPVNPVSYLVEQTRRRIGETLEQQSVTVDLDLLTDVNLLKRHVVKRCICGVDLNPMAVELAKVSLWLDAFTLGAPLNFLNHHLRCGNSLVGARFTDLQATTKDRLYALDYQPLLRAVNHVLLVSRMNDLTADEASRSASLYDRARAELAGYRVVFDLLTAEHFGFPQARELLGHGQLQLQTREAFVGGLKEEWERRLVQDVEALAERPDLHFFHWELEFPEVFFGYVGVGQRQVRHKDEIAPGSAGFDVIVGNPPYVRQEALKAYKPFLKDRYQAYDSAGDLYMYFQERELRSLRLGGRFGMIVANKWMRAGYGEKLRGLLTHTGQPLEVVDFGHAPIFPDADTFPCILIARRRTQPLATDRSPSEEEELTACVVPRADWDERMDLLGYVPPRRHSIPSRVLRNEGWLLEPLPVHRLLEKIRDRGTRLATYAGCKPYRGLLTGFNDAFIIDATTRARLLDQHPRSGELIKPLLRGRDIDRWCARASEMYLITIASSENHTWPWSEAGDRAQEQFQRTYPALHAHLSAHETALQQRQDKGRYWWELRSCDYMDLLARAKLLWQEIQYHSWFALDRSEAVINNKVFFVPSDDLALLAVLNSPLMWWELTRVLPHMKDEALSPAAFVMENIHICTGTPDQAKAIALAVQPLLDVRAQVHEWEEQTLAGARAALHLVEDDERLLDWLSLAPDAFVARMVKGVRGKGSASRSRETLTAFQQQARKEQINLLTRQLALERRLATLVEDAYALTSEERALLRQTRPVRDPLDVLAARIRGPVPDTFAAPDSPNNGGE